MTDSKEFVPYFYNHNKNLYNKFEFLKTDTSLISVLRMSTSIRVSDTDTLFKRSVCPHLKLAFGYPKINRDIFLIRIR